MLLRLAAGLSAGIAAAAAALLLCHLVSGRLKGTAFQRFLGPSQSGDEGVWWLRRWMRSRKEERVRQDLDRGVVRWVDLIYVGVAGGMNMHKAINSTVRLADSPIRQLLRAAKSQARAGESFVDVMLGSLETQGGSACRQVAHLLRDCIRRGLPAQAALADLQDDLIAKQRHEMRVRVRTLGLRLAVGTVVFLFPPVFVIIVLPNVLAFVGW